MPHLRLRGVDQQQAELLSHSLPAVLAQQLEIAADAVPLEWQMDRLLLNGQVLHKPLLEVHWFARPQELQDQIAIALTSEAERILGIESPISIVFYAMEKSAYYRDGRHFG